MNKKFDVFISYNSDDKSKVKEIVSQLISGGINPWMDDRMQAGIAQQQLEQQIQNSESAAIFVGSNGLGRYQELEMRCCIDQYIKSENKYKVIPVFLDDAPPETKLPWLLAIMAWVDFRKFDPDPIKELVRYIQGDTPSKLADIPIDTFLIHLYNLITKDLHNQKDDSIKLKKTKEILDHLCLLCVILDDIKKVHDQFEVLGNTCKNWIDNYNKISYELKSIETQLKDLEKKEDIEKEYSSSRSRERLESLGTEREKLNKEQDKQENNLLREGNLLIKSIVDQITVIPMHPGLKEVHHRLIKEGQSVPVAFDPRFQDAIDCLSEQSPILTKSLEKFSDSFELLHKIYKKLDQEYEFPVRSYKQFEQFIPLLKIIPHYMPEIRLSADRIILFIVPILTFGISELNKIPNLINFIEINGGGRREGIPVKDFEFSRH